MRTLVFCLFLVTASCSGEATSDAALPVTAPMKARDRLLHDLEIQKQKARERADQFDQASAPR
ncbi:MAG: hypothetical protein KDB80_16690 [Planctomycetes bacterium]|nr:hypothetical protein [Planctomycetota bacterium]